MNPHIYDMNHALANDKMSRYQAEAENHRLARTATQPQDRTGLVHVWRNAIGRGLVALGERVEVSTREHLPTV